MNPFRTLETTRFFALRAFGFVLILLGFLPQLRAGQFGLFTYERVEDTIEITQYPRDAVGTVEIPAVIEGLPVTSLGQSAFTGCTNLTRVTIPDTVTRIGIVIISNPDAFAYRVVGTFSGCTQLAGITIPNGVTTLGHRVFSGCTSLTDVTIPDTVTTLGEAAFAGCTGLTRIALSNGLSTLGYNEREVGILEGCTGLTVVTVPDSVTHIQRNTFRGCTALMAIEVNTQHPVYYSVDGVLFSKDRSTLVRYPTGKPGSYTFPHGVTGIGGAAFAGSTGLTRVIIPDSVTNIGHGAFFGCTGLTTVTIPASITSFADYAFSGCTALTDVTLQPGLTAIGAGAFSGCIGLTDVSFPSSVTDIGGFMFIEFGSSRPGAFEGCTGLVRVNLQPGLRLIGNRSFAGCTRLNDVTIPDGVTVGDSAFSGCIGLTHVTIPSSVSFTSTSHFSGCTGLTRVTFQPGLRNLSRDMFAGCTGLTSLVIPASVSAMESRALSGCTALTGLYFQGNRPITPYNVLEGTDGLTAYYLAGTTGWGPNFFSAPTALWTQPLLLSDAPGSGVSADGFGFTISWAPNASVVVEASPQLDPPAWTPVGTNLLTDGSSRFADPQWAAHPNRFYRLRTP